MDTNNKIEVEVSENWIIDDLEVWNWSNSKRYKNYLAIVTRDEDGTFKYDWLKESRESDEFFNIAKVQVGDVLMAGNKDSYKNRSQKMYYAVLEKDEDHLLLGEADTYRKAKSM